MKALVPKTFLMNSKLGTIAVSHYERRNQIVNAKICFSADTNPY